MNNDGLIVVAVDDEPPALAELAYLLDGTPGIAQVRTASTATAALELLQADETIAVELGGVTRYVKRSDIVYVEAQRDYVRLHTRTAGHLVRVPLANLEERWAPAGFLRVHRRYLVNAAYVEGLRTAGGRLTVDLGEEQSVPVSRRHTPAVKAALVESRRLERDT